MNVGGLIVHLDGCGLDIFSDLEKDFFGADVQSEEEDFEVILEYKVAGVPQGEWNHFGLEKPRD